MGEFTNQMINSDISRVFLELADKIEMIETGSAVPFKKKTYLNAAKVIGEFKEDIVSSKQLVGIPGIGKGTLEKIDQILSTGTISTLQKFKDDYSGLLKIDGVGPVKAKHIFDTYGLRDATQIMEAINSGIIDDERLKINVERALMMKGYRLPWEEINEIALPIHFHMRLKCPSCNPQIAGSIRRKRETCKDIDVLICASSDMMDKVKEIYLEYDWDMVIANGSARIDTVKSGVAVQGWFIPREFYGAAIMHCTGSGDFNQGLRFYAKEKNWKLSEYGLVHRETEDLIEGMSEEKIFNLLGFKFIPPEERSDADILQKYKME